MNKKLLQIPCERKFQLIEHKTQATKKNNTPSQQLLQESFQGTSNA